MLRLTPPSRETTPEQDLVIAVYERAKLDLCLSDRKLRRQAQYFWRAEGLDWRAVLAGDRQAGQEWLRRSP